MMATAISVKDEREAINDVMCIIEGLDHTKFKIVLIKSNIYNS